MDIKVWHKNGVWHAAVPLPNPGDPNPPGDDINQWCDLATEAIRRASGGQHGEVMPAGPTIVGGSDGEEWNITPALEPRQYLFTDAPLAGLLPLDRCGDVIRTPTNTPERC